MGKVIVVASGKGGTGKSMFVSNMGAILAMAGKKVVLIDMDMGLRNLDLYLGLENRVVYNVMDVLSGMCRIQQAMIKDKRFDDLYLMAASPNKDDRDITKLHMKVLCEKLAREYDYVIIDAPAGMGEGFQFAATAADMAVVITEADIASIRDADTIDRELTRMGILKRYCVINRVKAELMTQGAVPGLAMISQTLRMDIAGLIQYDDNVLVACNKGVPIVFKAGTYIERNIRNIVERITGEQC